jgi:hypothetical protein
VNSPGAAADIFEATRHREFAASPARALGQSENYAHFDRDSLRVSSNIIRGEMYLKAAVYRDSCHPREPSERNAGQFRWFCCGSGIFETSSRSVKTMQSCDIIEVVKYCRYDANKKKPKGQVLLGIVYFGIGFCVKCTGTLWLFKFQHFCAFHTKSDSNVITNSKQNPPFDFFMSAYTNRSDGSTGVVQDGW